MGVFVPSSRGDPYTTPPPTVVGNADAHQTFDTPVFAANRRIKNTENTVIGSNKFYNDTRSQLKTHKDPNAETTKYFIPERIPHSNTPAGRTCFPVSRHNPLLHVNPVRLLLHSFPVL
jgi:hypothetical protein